jgi:hypothetical protein
VTSSLSFNNAKTTALFIMVAAVTWLGVSASTTTPAHAGNASENGALDHTGACHETLHANGANHQEAVQACGSI